MSAHVPKVAVPNVERIFQIVTILLAIGVLLSGAPQAKPDSAQAGPKAFATPAQAAKEFIEAANTNDVTALIKILGPDGRDLVTSDDPVADKDRALRFAALARDKQSVTFDAKNANKATLVVGNDDWPLPIPIVKRGGNWYFDSKSGRQEVLFRRIGNNELDAIDICRGFVEAQNEYALQRHDNSPLNQYAQQIISTPGKHDGLAWQNSDGSWGGPVGHEVAIALAQGYSNKTQPYHGYYFKVLKGQGPAAPQGQVDFLVNGVMIGGFALAAAPAQYRVTGVKTFIVSHDGIVYQKDLGPNTLSILEKMDRYNPDKTWIRTDDEP
jgi:hypothetical protein